jgi:hypothetical protein
MLSPAARNHRQTGGGIFGGFGRKGLTFHGVSSNIIDVTGQKYTNRHNGGKK